MHPIFVVILIACAGWFFLVGSMAKRGIGSRIGLSLLGIVEFVIVSGVLEQIVKKQDFFLRAIRSGPDMGPIMTYIVLPTVGVVFLSGLYLKSVLTRRSHAKSEKGTHPIQPEG